MKNGKTQLSREEQKELFALVVQSQKENGRPFEVWYALVGADGSARDRATGFLTALANGPTAVPDAGTCRKARALLEAWDASKPARPGRKKSSAPSVSDGGNNGGAGVT